MNKTSPVLAQNSFDLRADVSPNPPAPANASDPFGLNTQSTAVDPFGLSAGVTETTTDWLGSAGEMAVDGASNLPFSVHVQQAINDGLIWIVEHFRPFFQVIRSPIDAVLTDLTDALLAVPWALFLVAAALLAWQFAGRWIALGTAASLAVVLSLGIWPETMITLALVLTSLFFCLILGLPLGIALSRSDTTERWVRPLLDAMQTTPAFVYLVPVVMLFGTGNVAGMIVTIVFALPPLVRLTNLGIRQVRGDLIEAGLAYGASPWQMLTRVQMPLALPSVMAGINQSLMLSLSMVVIASMISVAGLGQMVLRGIGRLDMGLAAVGGLGIVLLAIVLDRITQTMGRPKRGGQRFWHDEPLGWLLRAANRKDSSQTH